MNRKFVIIGIVAVLFSFAGFNLYSYFQEQKTIQAEEDRQETLRQEARKAKEEQRRIDRENLKAEEAEKAAAREADRQAALQKQRDAKAAREAERKKQNEDALVERDRQRKEILDRRVAKARTLKSIEGMPSDFLERINDASAELIRDEPKEFLGHTLDKKSFGRNNVRRRLLDAGTDMLMIFAAANPDIDVIKALVDIGFDVNAQNKSGYTPLMFASAYNSPEVVRFLLGQGADKNAKAYVQNMNALHVASLLNPNPDTLEVLVQAGIPLEQETENGYTALLIAAEENQNIEVPERLASLGANTKARGKEKIAVGKIVAKRVKRQGEYRHLYTINETIAERALRALQ